MTDTGLMPHKTPVDDAAEGVVMIGRTFARALRRVAVLSWIGLGGCGLLGSDDAEKGELTITVQEEILNYHSVAISWTTTFADTLTLKYRLFLWDDNTTKSADIPEGNYFEIDRSSSGEDRLIPISGFDSEATFFMWVIAYRENPFTIVRESDRVSFTTCASPYVSLPREPRRVSGFRAVAVGDKVYVVWPDRVCERFDPASSEWTTLAPVPHAHEDFGATALKGKLYVIGGSNSRDVDVFDPATGAWETLSPIPSALSVRTAVSLGDTIYTFASSNQLSGNRSWSDYPDDRQVAAYVPSTDEWSARTDRPGGGKVMGSVIAFGDEIFLFGNYDEGTADFGWVSVASSESIFVFDPARDSWTDTGIVPDGRVGFHAVASFGYIYVFGGVLSRIGAAPIWTTPPVLKFDGFDGWAIKTLPGAPLDFGEDGAAVAIGATIYLVNGGNRWPGIMGTYVPQNDDCGMDIFVWDDLVPYGIPYTARIAAGASGASRFTVHPARPRR